MGGVSRGPGNEAMYVVHMYTCITCSLACAYNYCSCCSCDVNLKDHRGFTPLHTAVAANRPHIVRTLVAKGASVVVKDKSGKTPLHHCMELVSDIRTYLHM